jgi:hypothetical protein
VVSRFCFHLCGAMARNPLLPQTFFPLSKLGLRGSSGHGLWSQEALGSMPAPALLEPKFPVLAGRV